VPCPPVARKPTALMLTKVPVVVKNPRGVLPPGAVSTARTSAQVADGYIVTSSCPCRSDRSALAPFGPRRLRKSSNNELATSSSKTRGLQECPVPANRTVFPRAEVITCCNTATVSGRAQFVVVAWRLRAQLAQGQRLIDQPS